MEKKSESLFYVWETSRKGRKEERGGNTIVVNNLFKASRPKEKERHGKGENQVHNRNCSGEREDHQTGLW